MIDRLQIIDLDGLVEEKEKNFQAYISRTLDARFEQAIAEQRINRRDAAVAILEWFCDQPQEIRAIVLRQVRPSGASAMLRELLKKSEYDEGISQIDVSRVPDPRIGVSTREPPPSGLPIPPGRPHAGTTGKAK